ncbi:putative protein without homology [Propionibacterium freudenreichii subsp. shermanii]|nr:putative protein without homology [Propionibacterium freudenreichii subsp. shermanii]
MLARNHCRPSIWADGSDLCCPSFIIQPDHPAGHNRIPPGGAIQPRAHGPVSRAPGPTGMVGNGARR